MKVKVLKSFHAFEVIGHTGQVIELSKEQFLDLERLGFVEQEFMMSMDSAPSKRSNNKVEFAEELSADLPASEPAKARRKAKANVEPLNENNQ